MAEGEWEHIDWIRRQISPGRQVAVGIGDDAAVVIHEAGQLLVTVDMLLEGVHFERDSCSPRDIGRKAMNVNLSDIAAMAGRPTSAVIAVGLPVGCEPDLGRELFAGIAEAAERFDVAIVGGDTNRSPGGLVVAITLHGVPTGSGPVLRAGAKPGDILCVTGALGYSLAGKHLQFAPRVAEAQQLHTRYHLHAMIDLSDGLGSDLLHVTTQSDCGAIVDAEALPIQAPPPGDDQRSALDHALNDGEDFELLFALPVDDAERLLAEQPLAIPVTKIGAITADRTIGLRRRGQIEPWKPGGFVHRW